MVISILSITPAFICTIVDAIYACYHYKTFFNVSLHYRGLKLEWLNKFKNPKTVWYKDTKSIMHYDSSNDSFWLEVNSGASFRCSFGPNSAWGSIKTTTIGKTHSFLIYVLINHMDDKIKIICWNSKIRWNCDLQVVSYNKIISTI